MYVAINKNPNRNRVINPIFNRAINPNFNRTINPNFNRTINPNFNRTINPNFNRTINPNFNRTVNPNFNRTINPNFNRTINPNFNRTINPNFNRNYSGLFLFNSSMNTTGFAIVSADGRVLILYNENLINDRIGIRHPQNGFSIFNMQMRYVGHFESNSQNGYNQFDSNNNWIGTVT